MQNNISYYYEELMEHKNVLTKKCHSWEKVWLEREYRLSEVPAKSGCECLIMMGDLTAAVCVKYLIL